MDFHYSKIPGSQHGCSPAEPPAHRLTARDQSERPGQCGVPSLTSWLRRLLKLSLGSLLKRHRKPDPTQDKNDPPPDL